MTEPKHIPLPKRWSDSAVERLVHWLQTPDEAQVPLDDDVTEEESEPSCNGICITAGELGLPYGGVAYAHPDCDLHGEATPDA